MSKIRVRFAPSPTGYLHIGGVRTALFNYLFARHHGGKYLVRVEDTDLQRSTLAFEEAQLAALTWLGLESDEAIVHQKDRMHEHEKVAHELMARGKAYPCFCAARDAQKHVEDLEQGRATKYDGTCHNKPYTEEDLLRPYAIRFKIPDDTHRIEFTDMILGDMSVDVKELDDFVIARQDGSPVYNFCVVLDDIYMNISHVIRGQDHVANTPKQLLLYQALGKKPPKFAHIPLILGPSGGKLSKRDAAVSADDYKKQGYLPDAFCNYLVRLGWSHGDQEVFSRDELVSYFTLDHVGKNPAVFDIKKLQWLNGVYLRQATSQQILTSLADIDQHYVTKLASLWAGSVLEKLIDLYKQRAVTLVELYNELVALAQAPERLDLSLIEKWRSDKTKAMLQLFYEQSSVLDSFNHEALSALAKDITTSHEEKFVTLAQPLRLALTGGIVSPSVFELLEFVGKQEALDRIEKLIKAL